MPPRSPLQSVRLDVGKMLSIAELIYSGTVSLDGIGRSLGMGQRKVRSLREWGCMANILEDSRSTTKFYLYIRRLNQSGKRYELMQLIYYWICRNNSIVHYIVHACGQTGGFATADVVQGIIDSSLLPTTSARNIREGVGVSLNSMVDSTEPASRSGLGPLGLIHKLEEREQYAVHPCIPEPLVAAYIIYANWPLNTAKVAIAEIALGRNSLGRIFFLDEIQVMGILQRLEEQDLVKVETVARINQIGIHPKLAADDILDMLVREAAS